MKPQEAFDFRREYRALSLLFATNLAYSLVQFGMLISSSDPFVASKVAFLAGGREVFSCVFYVLGAALLPYMSMQLFAPTTPKRLYIVRFTIYALLAAGVTRVYFGWVSRDLDYQMLTSAFVSGGGWYIAKAALLSISINSKQRRDVA